MRKPDRFRTLRFAGAAAAMLSTASTAAGAGAETRLAQASPFDGNWMTTLVCPAYGDAKGYNWQFIGQVRGGQYQGQYGTPGQAGSITVTGPIQPNGAAVLTARGLTGNPDFTPGHSSQMSPIFYQVTAQFQGAQGSGKRQEGHPCDLTFVRQ